MGSNKKFNNGLFLMKKGISSLCVVVLILLPISQATAAFETVGQGVRPLGMGGAFVAVADDPNAVWFNPAGLAQLDRIEVTAMYARLLPGLDADKLHNMLLGGVLPLGSFGTLGGGVHFLNADVYSEYVFAFGFAKNLGSKLALGLNLKYSHWGTTGDADPETGVKDKDFSSSSLAVDVGVLYDLGRRFNLGTFKIGLAGQNLNQPNISESGISGAELPRNLRADLLLSTELYLVDVGVSYQEDDLKLIAGGEYKVEGLHNFTVRAGGSNVLNNENVKGEVNCGFGLIWEKFKFDYAYVYNIAFEFQLGGCHRISLGYKF